MGLNGNFDSHPRYRHGKPRGQVLGPGMLLVDFLASSAHDKHSVPGWRWYNLWLLAQRGKIFPVLVMVLVLVAYENQA